MQWRVGRLGNGGVGSWEMEGGGIWKGRVGILGNGRWNGTVEIEIRNGRVGIGNAKREDSGRRSPI